MSGSIRHMFPGGNTSQGFYSFYRYILGQDEAQRIICIKGGPGTGKSSLMKNISAYYLNKGYDVEHHHCSSDNNSLDGVVIKKLNVALLDGTSPHMVDPMNPGAVDEILNMGECWREEGFKKTRKEIIALNKEIGKNFRRAYRFLAAARSVHEDWKTYNSEALDLSKLNKFMEEFKDKLFKEPVSTLGKDRHLFATAFTPRGIVTYVDSLYKDCNNIYVLNGGPSMGKTQILSYLSQEALKRNHYVEIYHDPFIPERLEHIIIPDLSLAILSSNEINRKIFVGNQIYLDSFCDKTILEKINNEISYDKNTFYNLVDKGLSVIARSKALHDDLEKYYVGNMDFTKVNGVYNRLIDKINGYEKELNIK